MVIVEYCICFVLLENTLNLYGYYRVQYTFGIVGKFSRSILWLLYSPCGTCLMQLQNTLDLNRVHHVHFRVHKICGVFIMIIIECSILTVLFGAVRENSKVICILIN